MRFAPESLHGANNGLAVARGVLEPVKAKYPWISYGDLWTLAGVAAIQVGCLFSLSEQYLNCPLGSLWSQDSLARWAHRRFRKGRDSGWKAS